MSHQDVEPLEPRVWLLQLKKLAQRSLPGADELETALRHAFHLNQLTPRPLRHFVSCRVTEDVFENWLGNQAFSAAALALVGDRLGLRLELSPGGGPAKAEVWFPGGEGGASGSDPSVAAAILMAWLACLATLDKAATLN